MQLSFGDAEGLAQRKQTRRELFLNEMDHVVPWTRLLGLIERHYPVAGRPGRQPYPLATMLRVHLLQQWYALSDPAMEEALYDTAVVRRFAGISGVDRIPDETTILNFRRLLETHGPGGKMLEAVNAHLQRKGLSLRAGPWSSVLSAQCGLCRASLVDTFSIVQELQGRLSAVEAADNSPIVFAAAS